MGRLLQQQQGYTVYQRHLCTIARIKGKVIHGVKSGPKQYLSAEEETESQICIYLTRSCVISSNLLKLHTY